MSGVAPDPLPDAPEGLDPGIARYVQTLRQHGVHTFESCDANHPGHVFPEPTIRFAGTYAEGFAALSVALTYRLPVKALRRYWRLSDGELCGPDWEITFRTIDTGGHR